MAVLVSKATCEIPPKFAGRPPVNPERDCLATWKGAQGLAEDIRYYGKWMRDEAHARIGHLYPKVAITEAMAAEREDLKPYVGKELTVIAWLWARTVASPDPMMHGAHVPLASTFVLSSKRGKEAIVVPEVNRDERTYRLTAKVSGVTLDELARAKSGTKVGHGANFTCLVSSAPISGEHIKAEGMAGRMGARLMAVVVEGQRGRVYLDSTEGFEESAFLAQPEWKPQQELPKNPRWFSPPDYGMPTYGDLFTDRQLVALTTFSDLVSDAREKVLADAIEAGLDADAPRLADGGTGAQAYADAVATYLGLAADKATDYWSGICSWHSSREIVRNTFSRQALPMVWDYAEANPISNSTGNWAACVDWVWKVIAASPAVGTEGTVVQQDAAGDARLVDGAAIATDPPYYDNIGYADLSDFFYVWQRRTLREV